LYSTLAALVFGRDFIGLVDDHQIEVCLTRHQSQAKLLLHGGG